MGDFHNNGGFKGQIMEDGKEKWSKRGWYLKHGMGIPSHQALVLNPTNLLLGMPYLRREVSKYNSRGYKLPSASNLWEGGLMSATISKSDNKRSFQLQKGLPLFFLFLSRSRKNLKEKLSVFVNLSF